MALIVGNTSANNTGDVLNATSSTGDEVRGLTGNDTIYVVLAETPSTVTKTLT